MPEAQAKAMEEDMHRAISANKPLPPGFHAHLGNLYYQMGKYDLAVQEFQKEKAAIPGISSFHGSCHRHIAKEMRTRHLHFGILIASLALAGCVTKKPYDYTNFRAHPPRSIIVLPPLNQSTDVRGTYSYLSTATRPLAEMGYYVFPVVEVDELMKENGLPTAGEMHQAPLDKIGDIFGADAVLYVTLKQYGSKYEVISSVTTVSADAKLVDVKTGVVLWEGVTTVSQGSGDSGDGIFGALITAAVTQIVNSATDPAHDAVQHGQLPVVHPKKLRTAPRTVFSEGQKAIKSSNGFRRLMVVSVAFLESPFPFPVSPAWVR